MPVCTLIKDTNWMREILYGREIPSNQERIESYTYVKLNEAEVDKIMHAKSDEVQKILKEIY